jgi:hypothetical protein
MVCGCLHSPFHRSDLRQRREVCRPMPEFHLNYKQIAVWVAQEEIRPDTRVTRFFVGRPSDLHHLIANLPYEVRLVTS